MRHIIQKQQLILVIPPGIDAFSAQHAASRLFRERLLPWLERIFDELSGEGEIIHLDRFFIDLGVIGFEALQSGVMDESIYRLMKEEVGKAIEKELAARPAALTGIREGILARWWYYMEHGRLPWNTDRLTEEDLLQILELFSVDFSAISRLRVVLDEDPLFGMRLVAQHTGWFLENLVAVLSSARQEGVAEIVTQATRVHRVLERYYRRPLPGSVGGRQGGPSADSAIIQSLRDWAGRMSGFLQAPVYEKRSIVWRRLLREAARHPVEFAAKGAVEVLVRDVPCTRSLLERVLEEEDVGEATPFIEALRRELAALRKDGSGRDTDVNRENAARKPETGAGEPPARIKNEELLIPERRRNRLPVEDGQESEDAVSPGEHQARPNSTEEPLRDSAVPAAEKTIGEDEIVFVAEDVDEEGIYVPNAGLVLVHPFLSTLFHRTGWWEGAGFRDLESRQKAILLLHFLATGDRHPPEYALVFPKMLCGYALEMPVPGELVLEEEQYAEGLVMLENVIRRWEKLGNSSVDGLREAFLRREGKLFSRGDRLMLRVGTSGVDVLLDYLPWGMGLVKLPWLRDILYVEWR